ncbi:MAG: methyl-accepting chemotaxis protein [Proteobacteria bacterium]|nr:methyl-accepting chemotaxis protein [Pseudomonadota bacterium]NOG60785.1 methyl-accepting chemotaxis protein [Pseudomonadota bacterium]
MKIQFKNKLFLAVMLINIAYTCIIVTLYFAISNTDKMEVVTEIMNKGLFSFFFLLVITIVGSIYYVNKLYKPIERLKNTIKKISDGDLDARIGLKSGDEFQDISTSIDTMLNERVSVLTDIEDDNEQLNDSVVALLETVAQLAQKNLTIKAKVNEDITGPLADALNLMTSETTAVLNEVTRISGDVAETSNLVKTQSDNVLLLANKEQNEVENAAIELKSAAEAMNRIARLAEQSNAAAEGAIRTTITAMSTVSDTVESINNIRDTIHETEKRIKRLGERSQEIGTAVNLINNISERTHILALNASMHAASAGEAGRGFAVVADEVQRLAENAREATSQIGTLVNNIQIETVNTVNTMNELITQVVGGSQLAEAAGQQMEETQSTTAELVSMVQKIAENATTQAENSNKLRERTDIIRDSVRKTGAHLQDQTNHTDELVEQAMLLVAAVGVFKLSDEEMNI